MILWPVCFSLRPFGFVRAPFGFVRALGPLSVKEPNPFARLLDSFARVVDRATGRLGRFVSWLVLVMILIGAYNAIVRYLGRFTGTSLSSNLYLELQWYLFSLIFLLGAGYALKENAHVRVDVVYGRLERRAQAWINVIGSVCMLIPFCVFVLWVSWPAVRNSWAIREVSADPGGLPRYPLKAVILLCFVLLLAQGVTELIKDVRILRGSGGGADGDGGGGDGGTEASDATDPGKPGHEATARPGGL